MLMQPSHCVQPHRPYALKSPTHCRTMQELALPRSIPMASLSTFASGAKQFVVQDPFETIRSGTTSSR